MMSNHAPCIVTPCYGADEALDVLAMAAQEIEGSIQDFDIVVCMTFLLHTVFW
jgi:2-polyprenyl-3-methyl-5-hydroxy-6-metoxy-1,4-benzoquinol methylase